MKKLGWLCTSPLIKFTLLGLLAVLVASWIKNSVDEAGGAYAYSPDGKWLAEISDGYSKTHKLPYAVVKLWDLKKYPGLKSGIRWNIGKASTVRFEFPQNFRARDSECNVSWETNSLSFAVTFRAAAGSSTFETSSLRRFRYDIPTDTFSLETSD